MEKLKELLTREQNLFSTTSGSKYLAEFAKAHPVAIKNFEQPHTNEDVYGVAKEEINGVYDIVQPFVEQIYPLIADMFQKAKEMQKTLPDKMETSLAVFLGGRLISAALCFMIHEAFQEADQGLWNKIQVIDRMKEVDPDVANFVRKATVSKILSEITQKEIYYIFGDFMKELKLPDDPRFNFKSPQG